MDGFDKKTLRAAARRRAAEADAAFCAYASERIAGRLEGLEAFRRARIAAFYLPLPGEVDIRAFIARWSGLKRIALPLVKGDDMVFVEYAAGDALAAGPFGVLEPAAGSAVHPRQIDLIVVPGLAFSTCGERLGRGRGYYDRFLSTCPAFRAGVCFESALVEKIACDPHDLNMDAVVTEERVLYFAAP